MFHKYSKTIFILLAIIVLSTFVRVWDVGGPDVITDEALYSFRSVGYIDYVAATNRQSTPVSWFPEPVWWQGLSFHDAPPLVFLIQWLFFSIGGDNVWTARLPFVIGGVLSLLYMYFLGKRLVGEWVGIAGALILGVMNYAVWFSRTGLLDGFLILWVILSLYSFLRARENSKWYLALGLFFAAGILTKYTFLFMAPVFLLALLFWRREAFRMWYVYVGIGLVFLLITPLIIYNIEMFQAREHLDAPLSSLFGMDPDDFNGLQREVGGSLNILGPLIEIFKNNFSSTAFAMFVMSVPLFSYGIFRLRMEKSTRDDFLLVLLGFISAAIMLSLIGRQDRFGAILIPFIVLFMSIGFSIVWRSLYRPWKRGIFIAIAAVLLLGEIFFTIQTQLLPIPLVEAKWASAVNRPRWDGYHELEEYVKNFYAQFPEPFYVATYSDIPQLKFLQRKKVEALAARNPTAPQQKNLLIYDDQMEWFSTLWIFERRFLYHALPIHPLSTFLENVDADGVEFYTQYGLENAVFILTTEKTMHNEEIPNGALVRSFVKEFESTVVPVDTVKRKDGKELFRVYRLPLED